MNAPKSRAFEYIKLGDHDAHYFCLQQNPVSLARILNFALTKFRHQPKRRSQQLSLSVLVARLRNAYRSLRRTLLLFYLFLSYKYKWRKLSPVLLLPAYGQICLPVHRGYKIFDLRRKVVIKVFDHDIDTSTVAAEVEQLNTVSQIEFAPSLRGCNIEERWYEEDYVPGTLHDSDKPLDTAALLKHFRDAILPKLHALVLFKKPTTTHALKYAYTLQKALSVSRLGQHESTVGEFAKIQAFVDSTIGHLGTDGNPQINLVFTHGDFCPANMLTTRQGLKLIDWENAGYRSALFDFYSYFFYRAACRNVAVSKIVFEINKALPLFISTLSARDARISTNLIHMEQVYRWIYYLEYICQDVERERTDKQLNILAFIRRYMEAFHCYDEMMAGHKSNNTQER